MMLTVYVYSKPLNSLSYKQHEAEGEIYDIVEQRLSSIPLIKAFSREDEGEKRMRDVTKRTLDATIENTKAQFKFKIWTSASTAAGTALIIWIGGAHVLDGQLTVGSVLVFISYVRLLYSPLEDLMYTSMTLNGAAGNARRVIEILDTEHEVKD